MKKVITYGTYDLFHQGHLNLLKRAKELGDYLIVGVTTDNFDLGRGKLNVCNNVIERIEAIKQTGLADQIIIEEYIGQKIDDILKYNVDIFAIGSDWEGKFDYLKEYSIDTSVEVNKIEYVSVKNNYIYYIQGKLNEMTFDTTNVIDNDFRIIVIVDFDNSTYAVYPLSDKDDYKKIIDSIKKINIDSNSNNRTIKSDLITKEKICVLYLSDYVNKLNYDIEEAYKLLDDTTKKNYSLEKFIIYINNNFDKITTDADKCLFETVGDKRIYTVIDKNGNRYVFRENGIMNYKVNFYLNDEESES